MVQVQWGHFIQLQKFIRIELNRPSNFEHSTPNETGELLKLLVKYWNILELQKPNSAGPLRSIQVKLVYSKNIQCIHWFIMVHHFPSKNSFWMLSGCPILETNPATGPPWVYSTRTIFIQPSRGFRSSATLTWAAARGQRAQLGQWRITTRRSWWHLMQRRALSNFCADDSKSKSWTPAETKWFEMTSHQKPLICGF